MKRVYHVAREALAVGQEEEMLNHGLFFPVVLNGYRWPATRSEAGPAVEAQHED